MGGLALDLCGCCYLEYVPELYTIPPVWYYYIYILNSSMRTQLCVTYVPIPSYCEHYSVLKWY